MILYFLRLHESADKLFVVDFGTSSSIDGTTSDLNRADNMLSYGDKQVPTTTANGQSQLVQNTLCTTAAAGISKFAYWTWNLANEPVRRHYGKLLAALLSDNQLTANGIIQCQSKAT